MAFGGQVLFDSLDLELREQEVVLLRGENGSGKTTLLNVLTGNLEPDAGRITYWAGRVPRHYEFPRRWWQELNPFDHFVPEFVAREGISRTWQDVRLFGAQTLRDNIAISAPDDPGANPVRAFLQSPSVNAERDRRADALLASLGLAGRESSSADMISLGQSKRVAIARAVVAGARIVFLDEPLAGLDHEGISATLSLLESLVRERRITLVIVEHVFNQPHLRHLVTTDWLLHNGKIQVTFPSATPVGVRPPTPAKVPAPWIRLLDRTGDDTVRKEEYLPRGAMLTRLQIAGEVPRTATAGAGTAIELRRVIVRRGRRTIIGLDDDNVPRGLDLVVRDGELVVLQAPNGWGKSTLFETIAGLIPVTAGEILLRGVPVHNLPTWERIRRGIALLPSGHSNFGSLRVRDVLRLAGQSERAEQFGALADRTCSSLSGGEQQRVSLASVPPHPVVVYDEPFLALDDSGVREVRNLSSLGTAAAGLLLMPGTA